MTRPIEPVQQRGVLGAPAPAPGPAQGQPAGQAGGQAPHVRVAGPQTAPGTQAQPDTGRATEAHAAAVTEAEASAQTLRVAGLVAAAPMPPSGPPGGTVYGNRDDERDAAPGGRQPGLRIGWHTASLTALNPMGVRSAGTGLVLGADYNQQPVPIRLFRPEPTRVTLVGGVWAAQMLAFRALALGSQIVVMTVDPAAWHGFGDRAVGRADRVAVLHGEQPATITATAHRPVLVVHDLGTTGPSSPPAAGPWQTQLTVLRRLEEPGEPAVRSCDLVVLQRLHTTEAAVARTALQLDPQSVQRLQMLENEMLALIGGGANRYLWLHPTSAERQTMGNARR
ncbi:hypothetical protein GCM10010399_48060 [Dactylosporangium fulvum]|uniref:Uncharacterized protein n=1 Tax=Dactylosporangium fulvum TaxID=53359 RepID=A0ABY5VSB9_9ACTN|nr:hypothetical protein [Dactylosporangium fulvum]UWP80455.1 hypothetical protein Dfulv_35590 [Dactylosporangium fulvum]